MTGPLDIARAYDDAAARYAEHAQQRYTHEPLDRAMVTVLAHTVAGNGPVVDAGCGPGHLTAHLASLGVDAFGVDLSPQMIALARTTHPHLRFEVGRMQDLPVQDAHLAGVVANYSIIHTPPPLLPSIMGEFGRVLAPGGMALVSFQAHHGPGQNAEAFDHAVAPAHRYAPDHVAGLLADAGMNEVARLIIAAGEDPRRGFPQAHLLARRQ